MAEDGEASSSAQVRNQSVFLLRTRVSKLFFKAGPSGGAKVKKTTSLDYEASSEDSNDSTTRSSLTGNGGGANAGGRKSGNQSGYSSCSETARRGD